MPWHQYFAILGVSDSRYSVGRKLRWKPFMAGFANKIITKIKCLPNTETISTEKRSLKMAGRPFIQSVRCAEMNVDVRTEKVEHRPTFPRPPDASLQ